jgi:hypothetical protein
MPQLLKGEDTGSTGVKLRPDIWNRCIRRGCGKTNEDIQGGEDMSKLLKTSVITSCKKKMGIRV